MLYTEAKKFTDGLSARGIAPGLGNISALMSELGDPQDRIKTVHIAGTNGKGSVGAFLEAILKSAGYSVGRFSSPAVAEHLEMFTINGTPVSGSDYAECIERLIKPITVLENRGIYITSFEAETAAAFLLFEKHMPDHTIIECGMGGRLDSTNVLKAPELSVITSISLDHTAFLGNDLKSIALEKAGIIKRGVPAVTAEQSGEVTDVLRDAAAKMDTTLYIAGHPENVRYSDTGTVFDLGDTKSLEIRLPGTYQLKNAATAVKAAEVLGIGDDAIRRGLISAKWGFRFERIGKFILDGAHNPAAAAELAASAGIYLSGSTAIICGCFKDKDYAGIAEHTAHIAGHVYTVTPPGQRGLNAGILAGEFIKNGVPAKSCGSIAEAAAEACGFDNVLIFGSLSILAEAKRVIDLTNQTKGADK